MGHYAQLHIIEDSPDTVVVHSSTNLIHNIKTQTTEGLAAEVFSIGGTAKALEAQRIIISGIITRRNGMVVERNRREINKKIRELCQVKGSFYIDNDSITIEDIDERDTLLIFYKHLAHLTKQIEVLIKITKTSYSNVV